jgi:hypothetical protein
MSDNTSTEEIAHQARMTILRDKGRRARIFRSGMTDEEFVIEGGFHHAVREFINTNRSHSIARLIEIMGHATESGIEVGTAMRSNHDIIERLKETKP